MGAWGTGIFSDDLAADIRDEWRDAILAGIPSEEASRSLIGRYERRLVGDGEETVFWLALAAAQMETGRLQPEVRERALSLIDAGGDLEAWGSGERAARERALRRLGERLRGPQPPPKRLRARAGPDPGVEVGDIVRLWNARRTRSALFAVIGMREHRRQRWPRLLGLFWDNGRVPSAAKLARLPYLSEVDLSAFDGDEPPDHMTVAFPHVVTVIVARRGDELRPEIGEVVAHGVERMEQFDRPFDTMTGWQGVTALLDGRGFDIFLAVTRRRLERCRRGARYRGRGPGAPRSVRCPVGQALPPGAARLGGGVRSRSVRRRRGARRRGCVAMDRRAAGRAPEGSPAGQRRRSAAPAASRRRRDAFGMSCAMRAPPKTARARIRCRSPDGWR